MIVSEGGNVKPEYECTCLLCGEDYADGRPGKDGSSAKDASCGLMQVMLSSLAQTVNKQKDIYM